MNNIETALIESQEAVSLKAHHEKLLAWGLIACSIIFAVIVAFFLHGGTHGQYMDDYSDKASAHDFATGRWKLTFGSEWKIRPVGETLINNIGNALPEHELPVRLGILLIHLLNVFLLAKLASRLSRSAFAGILTGAFFLLPVFANEALLWFTAAVYNTISLCLLLVGFHCFLNIRNLKSKKDVLWFVLGVSAWLAMVTVYESGLFTFLLLPFFLAIDSKEKPHARSIWLTALPVTYIPIGIYGYLVERVSPAVTQRGGATLDLDFIVLHRVPSVLRNAWWLVTDWGIYGPLHEAFRLGWHEWLSVRNGSLLLGLEAGACLLPIVLLLPSGPIKQARSLAYLAVIGIAWAGLGLAPLMLMKAQIVEIRTLYIPFAGVALSTAALLNALVDVLPRWRAVTTRMCLLMAGIVVFFFSITMAGLVRTYQLRWDLDQKQVAAVEPIISGVPAAQLLWLMPVTLDERIVSAYWGREAALDRYIVGVFETPWSATDAIRLRFGERDVHSVTSNRWDRLHLTSVQRPEGGQVRALMIQDVTVPVDNLVAFTYQQGQLVLLTPLEIAYSNGASSTIVDLPLANQIARTELKRQPVRLELEHKD